MKAGRGQHAVYISIELENGTHRRYGWDVQGSLAYGLHSAFRWAKEELTKERVPGRSRIRKAHVTAEAA